ncbi:MAG: MFS transporter [Aquiluna sp.]|nr:MFS transporter [Aquiluna sp.]
MTENFKKRSLAIPVYLPSLLFEAALSSLLPIFPASATEFGFDLASAGAVTAAAMLGTLLFELPASSIVNRLGERTSMIVATVIAAMFGVLGFLNLGYWPLLLIAMGFGAMFSLFGLSRHSLLAAQVPVSHRAKAMSLLGGSFRGGAALGPILGSLAVAQFGTEAAYLVASSLCLVAMIAVTSVPKNKLHSPPSGQHGNVWEVAKRERAKLLTLGMASAIISAGRTIRMIGLPLLAIQLGIDPATASLIFGVTGVIDFALFYASGLIMSRWGKFWSSVPTLLALGVSYLFAFMVTDLNSFWILAAVTALANAASAGINMVLGADLAPDGARSEFLAAFRMMTSGGVVLAPLMITTLTALIALPAALAITGLLNFYGAFLFWKYLPIHAPDKKSID